MAYARWEYSNGEDAEGWFELMADDVRLGSLGDGAPGLSFAKARRGRAELRHYFTALASKWEMVSFEVNEFIAERDRVVVLSQVAWRHRDTGKVVESPKADVWRFRNGLAIDYFEFYDTARAAAAAMPD